MRSMIPLLAVILVLQVALTAVLVTRLIHMAFDLTGWSLAAVSLPMIVLAVGAAFGLAEAGYRWTTR